MRAVLAVGLLAVAGVFATLALASEHASRVVEKLPMHADNDDPIYGIDAGLEDLRN